MQAVADFCPADCDNEITVWRVARDGIRKELSWKPDAVWSEVTTQWRADNTVVVEFKVKGRRQAAHSRAAPDRP
jgi:hypothetical protein